MLRILRFVRSISLALALAATLPVGVLSADEPAETTDVPELLGRIADAYGGRSRLTECPGFRIRGKVGLIWVIAQKQILPWIYVPQLNKRFCGPE